MNAHGQNILRFPVQHFPVGGLKLLRAHQKIFLVHLFYILEQFFFRLFSRKLGDALQLFSLLVFRFQNAVFYFFHLGDLLLYVFRLFINIKLTVVQHVFFLDKALFCFLGLRFPLFFLLMYLVESLFRLRIGFFNDALRFFFGGKRHLLDLQFHGTALPQRDDPPQKVPERDTQKTRYSG